MKEWSTRQHWQKIPNASIKKGAPQTSWALQIYDATCPLADKLKVAVLQSDALFTGDSMILLQLKENGWVKKARPWNYVREAPIHL